MREPQVQILHQILAPVPQDIHDCALWNLNSVGAEYASRRLQQWLHHAYVEAMERQYLLQYNIFDLSQDLQCTNRIMHRRMWFASHSMCRRDHTLTGSDKHMHANNDAPWSINAIQGGTPPTTAARRLNLSAAMNACGLQLPEP